MNRKKLFLTLFFSILVLVFVLGNHTVKAATISSLPKSQQFDIGQSFDLEIRIDSEGESFNAAQATVQFPKDILEVKSLDYSSSATIFNFWLEEPKFSNSEGKVLFIGGITDGVVGASVLILKITFLSKHSGEGEIVIDNAAITAADGLGTNILSTIETTRFRVMPAVISPELLEPQIPEEEPEPLEPPPPTQITREPTIAKKLPVKPEISVPIYPDSVKWYNIITDFLTKWELPLDISDVSTALNQNLAFVPSIKSEGLFEEKIFSALRDGIWYLHVRFRNNFGWGPTAHYRLAIDTVPPVPFTVDVLEGLKTDNPTPTLQFKTSDGLSGLADYLLRVDNGDLITLESDIDEFKLPLQKPEKHIVSIRARDNAGNIRENSIELEILPIESPVITFINKELFIGEGDLVISGTAVPEVSILFFVKDKQDLVVIEKQLEVDSDGIWGVKIDELLKKGSYFIEVVAQDNRGALSLPVKSEKIKVRARPLFTLAGLEITQFWFFVGLIVILLIGFLAGWLSYRLWRERVSRKIIIAERDVMNVFNIIIKDVDKMLKNYIDKRITEREASEIEFLLNKIKNNIKRIQKYVIENIKEIGE